MYSPDSAGYPPQISLRPLERPGGMTLMGNAQPYDIRFAPDMKERLGGHYVAPGTRGALAEIEPSLR
jgi:hypothetical protein